MADRRFYAPENQEIVNITIDASATTSNAISLGGYDLVGLIFPTMTGATINFQGSVDNTNFYSLYNTSGTELEVTVTDNAMVLLTPADLVALQEVKVISSTAEASARTIGMIVRRLA